MPASNAQPHGVAPLQDAFLQEAPAVAARFQEHVKSLHRSLVDRFGPSLEPPLAESLAYQLERTVVRELVGPLCRVDPDSPRGADARVLDEGKLEAAARLHATETCLAWHRKAWSKLGELDAATLTRDGDFEYRVCGLREGHQVTLRQRLILNVSGAGKAFYQFPARLEVDGAAMSEQSYRDYFAAGRQQDLLEGFDRPERG